MRSGKVLLIQREMTSNMGSLSEVMVGSWGLWILSSQENPASQDGSGAMQNREHTATNIQPTFCLLWTTTVKTKSLFIPFHCILNMPHPVVTFLFAVGMNLIHLWPRRRSTNQEHPPFFIGYFSYYEPLKGDNGRLLVLGKQSQHIQIINDSFIKHHAFRKAWFLN